MRRLVVLLVLVLAAPAAAEPLRLYTVPTNGGAPRSLGTIEGSALSDVQLRWSADGRALYTADLDSGVTVDRVDIATGARTSVLDRGVSRASLSLHGERLAYALPRSPLVVRITGTGGRAKVTATVPKPPGGSHIDGLAWSPDATRLAVAVIGRHDAVRLSVLDAATGAVLRTLPTVPFLAMSDGAFAPDSNRLVVSLTGGVTVLNVDTGVLAKVAGRNPDGLQHLGWAPDGSAVAELGRRRVSFYPGSAAGPLAAELRSYSWSSTADSLFYGFNWGSLGARVKGRTLARIGRVGGAGGGGITPIATLGRGTVQALSLSPDGGALAALVSPSRY